MSRPKVKITLGPFGGSEENKVQVNGVDLSGGLKSFSLFAGVHEETTLIVHYNCGTVEIDGEMKVRHLCGFGHLREETGDDGEG